MRGHRPPPTAPRPLPAAVPLAVALLALLALPAVPALAQDASPLAVAPDRSLAEPLPLAPGEAGRVTFTITNAAEEGLVVVARASGPAGWEVLAQPGTLDLPPRGEGELREVVLTALAPERAPPGVREVRLVLVAVNSTTGLAAQEEVVVQVRVTHTALVLGLFLNPLPAPLDNAYGVFLLNVLFWSVLAGAIILLQDPIVKWLTRKAERHVTARIVAMLRVPMFLALVFLGFAQSWAALPPGPVVDLGQRLIAALTILVIAYVVYKAFRALLLYYTENIAARTKSELDDILVPVLEKVGAVVIVAGGVLYFIGTLGIDLTAFVAGGVVVSMVLAFAAQDTLSNFFAGLFLILDRPFVRGDDILLTTGGPLQNEVFRVDQVGLRSTRLYHYKNHQLVVVPNNELAKNAVVNLHYPDSRYRVHLPVGVAYGSDVDRVQALLERAAAGHPAVDTTAGFQPVASLEGFGDSSLNFVLLFFVRDVKGRVRVASDVRERILKEFAANGVEIPFPHRVVRVLGPGPAPDGGPGPQAPTARSAVQPDAPKRS